MDDLTQFLTERYDAAEARARGIEDNSEPWPGQWEADGNRAVRTYNGHVLAYSQGGDFKPGFAAYVADVDPAHRLADITLKRAILDEHKHYRVDYNWTARTDLDAPFGCPTCHIGNDGDMYEGGWCATVRQLGTEFTEHPGYKPGWVPEGAGR